MCLETHQAAMTMAMIENFFSLSTLHVYNMQHIDSHFRMRYFFNSPFPKYKTQARILIPPSENRKRKILNRAYPGTGRAGHKPRSARYLI